MSKKIKELKPKTKNTKLGELYLNEGGDIAWDEEVKDFSKQDLIKMKTIVSLGTYVGDSVFIQNGNWIGGPKEGYIVMKTTLNGSKQLRTFSHSEVDKCYNYVKNYLETGEEVDMEEPLFSHNQVKDIVNIIRNDKYKNLSDEDLLKELRNERDKLYVKSVQLCTKSIKNCFFKFKNYYGDPEREPKELREERWNLEREQEKVKHDTELIESLVSHILVDKKGEVND